MFKNTLNFLRNADQFGAIYKPSVKLKQQTYKTVLGGLLSLMIYGLSLAYIIYEFILWQNGAFLPKITSIKTSLKEFTFQFHELAAFHLRHHYQEKFIDPFDPAAIILQPVLYKVIDGLPQDPIGVESHVTKYGNEISIKNLKLVLGEEGSTEHPSIEYLLAFQKCSERFLLTPQSKCASADTVKTFYNQKANQLMIKNFIEQYNTSTRKIQTIEDDYFVSFDQEIVYYSQLAFEVSEVKVDSGLLFDSWESFYMPNNVIHIVQQMDLHYFEHYLGYEAYIIFQFEIAVIQDHYLIEFPKISEILANVGSIISFIFFFSYIALLINESQLEKEAVRSVIEMYYPQVQKVEIKKSYFGKIQNVLYNGRPIETQKFMLKYQQLEHVAKEKLTILNQIYELSRIQFIIQTLKPKSFIKSMHMVGIRLPELDLDQELEPREKQENEEKEGGLSKLDESMSVIANDLEGQQPQYSTIDQPHANLKISNQSKNRMSVQVFLPKLQSEDDEELELMEEDYGLLVRSQFEQTEFGQQEKRDEDKNQLVVEMVEHQQGQVRSTKQLKQII